MCDQMEVYVVTNDKETGGLPWKTSHKYVCDRAWACNLKYIYFITGFNVLLGTFSFVARVPRM
jgi:hypothetical protein